MVSLSEIRNYATKSDPKARAQIISRNLGLTTNQDTREHFVPGWSERSVSQQSAIVEAWRREAIEQESLSEAGKRFEAPIGTTSKISKPVYKGGKPSRARRTETRAIQRITEAGSSTSWAAQVSLSHLPQTQQRRVTRKVEKSKQPAERTEEEYVKRPLIYPKRCPNPSCSGKHFCKFSKAIYCYSCRQETRFEEDASGHWYQRGMYSNS